ncbi:MAG: hypothetical protein CVU59_00610 [Deltaproteobacteria bacterium HGW-Deltaproteobacteria-17]|nr:MAG: hypothetical protein CVU59_00610 [Deltaproteobacteria bacterium HGW-Deltaproteobacteria-17]
MKNATAPYFIALCLLLPFSCDDNNKPPCGSGSSYTPVSMRTLWTINGTRTFLGNVISFDTCLDVNATYAAITITGPENYLHTGEILCTAMEYSVSDDKCTPFPQGPYTIEVTLQNSARQPVAQSKTVQTRVYNDGNPPEVREIDFDLESFFETFNGTLWYKLLWNGANCAAADPAVATVNVEIYDADETVLGVGHYSGACIPDKSLQGIPTGDYTLRVTGQDDVGVVNYCGTMDIQVGAGITNPSWELNVTGDATACADFVP